MENQLTNFTINPRGRVCGNINESFEKSHVKASIRKTKSGKMVAVKEHEDKRQKHHIDNMKKINTLKDANNFIHHLYNSEELNFHRDDNFEDYIDRNGKDSYTKKEAEHRESLLDQTDKVFSKHKKDIYEEINKHFDLFEKNNSKKPVKKSNASLATGDVRSKKYNDD